MLRGFVAYLTDNAIVLRVTDFSETSQIAAMFTQEHGLVPLLAKGAKRASKSGSGKMSGPLDLLAAGEVMFLPPKGGELGTLAGWQLTDQRNGLRQNLGALNAAFVAAEVALSLLHPHDPHEELFLEMEATLALLPTLERARALVAFAKAGLVACGYSPEFENCIVCGQVIRGDGEYRYSPSFGGVSCIACSREGDRGTGASMAIGGRIALGLGRLPSPRALQAVARARAGEHGALLAAMLVLIFHLETLSGRGFRTRSLLGTIFAAGVP